VSEDATAVATPPVDRALALVTTLAGEVGPRRPTSTSERIAVEVVADVLRSAGIEAHADPFAAYSTFAQPFGVIAALSTAPALLPRHRRGVRGAVAGLGAALLYGEGGLVHAPLTDLLSRRGSQNLVARVEARGEAARTLCLVAHVDSSRSGLLFHPALGAQLNRLIALQAVATLLLPAEPLLARTAAGRAVLAGARAICAGGLGVLVERELRGVDVPGANDNASGVGAVVELAAEAAAEPLESTRLVVLITACEESGLLGARAFLRRRDTNGWLFLNFDSVGSTATLRYTRAEGMVRRWPCDPALVALAERVADARPELALEPADGPIGLTYDATAALARGGRALTFVAGDRGRIPNYHQPSDTVANLDPQTLSRAVAVGREMIARIDRGEAD
jgi:Peptidase family M28